MRRSKIWKVIRWCYHPVTAFYDKHDVATDRTLSIICFTLLASLLLTIGLSFVMDASIAYGFAVSFYCYMYGGYVVYCEILSERERMITILATENEPPTVVKNGY